MATPTTKETAKHKKSSAARSKEVLLDSIADLTGNKDIPRAADILKSTAEVLGSDAIGKMLAEQIASDNPNIKRHFLRQYFDLQKSHESNSDDINETVVQRLTTEQAYAMIERDFGLKRGEIGNALELVEDESGEESGASPEVSGGAESIAIAEANREG